jgi:phenylalanyl-tRNA synthetase beta chain
MNLSFQWLKEYVNITASPQEIGALLTKHAQEVAEVRPLFKASLIALGQVLSVEPIEGSKNKKCQVDVNGQSRTIVCGASNVASGQTVIVALPGATLPGGKKIEVTPLGGILSEGMICSLSEIGINPKFIQEEGIHVIAGQLDQEALEDMIIELDLTPNRMDLLSVLGCAYEVGALTHQKVKLKDISIPESATKNPYQIHIETDDCHAYYGRLIENITVKESPEWLKVRLMAAGIRPINNIVDITNYVMIDLGQPLHAFDHDQLSSNIIRIRNAKPKETFTTLDQQLRTLTEKDIVITDDHHPVALGGVMGGLDSEVTLETVHVFLESALFEPKVISKTSRRLDLRSESSMRFERGVSPDRAVLALNKAAQLMAELGSGSVAKGVAEAIKKPHQPRQIEITISKINQTLGIDLKAGDIGAIFNRLDLPFKNENEHYTIAVPPRRIDLEIAQDLIEEIGRCVGYDHLPSHLPSTVSEGQLSPVQKKRRQVKTHLEGLGFSEVITYSLKQEKKDLPFIKTSLPVFILRPLNEANQTLKQSLIPALLDVLSYHQARQMDDVMMYEWSKSYQTTGESERLGLAMMGRSNEPSWNPTKAVDFYQMKGMVEHVLHLYGVEASYHPVDLHGYHPHQSAAIVVSGKTVGHLGQVHPLVLRDYDLENVFVAELDVATLSVIEKPKKAYQPVSKVPFVMRDVAFTVPLSMPAMDLVNGIHHVPIDALQNVEIIDVYQGAPLKESEKSIALRIYLSKEGHTFKTEEIDERMKALTDALTSSLNISQRL